MSRKGRGSNMFGPPPPPKLASVQSGRPAPMATKVIKCRVHTVCDPRVVCRQCVDDMVAKNKQLKEEIGAAAEWIRNMGTGLFKAHSMVLKIREIAGELLDIIHDKCCGFGSHHPLCGKPRDMLAKFDEEMEKIAQAGREMAAEMEKDMNQPALPEDVKPRGE